MLQSKTNRIPTAARLSLTLLLGVMLWSSEGFTQQRSEGTTRIVVLQVKGGGTRALRKSIEALGRTEVKNQRWFLREIEDQELDPKGLLGRPSELQALCGSSKVNYIIDVGATKEVHEVRVVDGSTGSVVRQFDMERSSAQLSLQAADEIAEIIQILIDSAKSEVKIKSGQKEERSESPYRKPIRKDRPQKTRKSYVNRTSTKPADRESSDPVDSETAVPSENQQRPSERSDQESTSTNKTSWRDRVKKKKAQTGKRTKTAAKRKQRDARNESSWSEKSYETQKQQSKGIILDTEIGLGKRSISWAGRNGAVLNYESKTYPGFSLNLDCYPSAWAPEIPTSFGLHVEFGMGFDSVSIQTAETSPPQTVTVQHVDLGLDGVYRLYASNSTSSMVAFFAGARMQRLDVDTNPTLPSSNLTALILGAKGVYAIDKSISTGLRLGISPFGVLGDTAAEFGETSSTTSFLAHLIGLYRINQNLSVTLGYRLTFAISSFTGTGTRDFLDTQANDFQHHASAGARIEF